mgnify:CR=1 FL=1
MKTAPLGTPSRRRPKPAAEPLCVRLADTPQLVGLSVRGVAAAIKRGEIRAIRRGRAILVPWSELRRFAGVVG